MTIRFRLWAAAGKIASDAAWALLLGGSIIGRHPDIGRSGSPLGWGQAKLAHLATAVWATSRSVICV